MKKIMENKILALALFLMVFLLACAPLELLRSAAVNNDLISEPTETETPTEPSPETGQTFTEIPEITPSDDLELQTPTPDPMDRLIVTERSIFIESEDPRYEIQLVYPILEGDSEMTAPFNFEMENLVTVIQEVFINNVEESAAARGDDATQATSFLEMDYEMTFQSNKVFSVYLPITTYVAVSPHPSLNSFSYNYDAENEKFLLLRDLFLAEADPNSVIIEMVEDELLKRDFGYQAGVAEAVLLRRDNWNILQEGLRMNFDPYEVGPGAAGPQYVVIPWDDLSGILDFDGLVERVFDNQTD